jgi:DNA repair exonuclease SbcCD ATPase subunit
MIKESQDFIETVLLSESEESLVRLISGIDRPLIVDLLRRNPKLHAQLFPGFRPHRPPWTQVPTKLARYARGNIEKMWSLVEMWLSTNGPLCQMVAEEVSTETIEDDVAELLAGLGLEERDRLLWALLLDEREEIQAALVGGLREALTDESSALMVRADQYRLVGALEVAHQEITDLKADLRKLEEQNQLLRRRSKQTDELQAEQQRLLDSAAQAETQRQEAIHQREIARQEVEALQVELAQEQTRSRELQQSVSDLKASLEAAIASQQETTEEVKRRLDETLATLEDVRKDNAKLRLKASRLEEDRTIAYNKRDEERIQAETLTAQLGQLKRDKEVIIAEKREIHERLKQIEPELHGLREALTVMEEERRTMLSPSQVDDAWDKTVDALSNDLALMLSEQEAPISTVQSDKRWADWQTWQQMEAALVRPLLELPVSMSSEDLAEAERVQKLLALRWYLLEWLKLSILESLRQSNLVTDHFESQGREEIK